MTIAMKSDLSEYMTLADQVGVPPDDADNGRYSVGLLRELAANFPPFDPGVEVRGPYVLIQELTKPGKTRSGLLLLRDTKDFEQATVSVGRVIQVGSGAYKSADGIGWGEGPWCRIGDYVRVPRLSDEKWLVGDPEGAHAIFRMVAHDSVRGVFTDLSLIPTYNTVVA